MSNVKIGFETQDIILGFIQGEHRTKKSVQIFILGWGHRTNLGGDTAHNCFFYHYGRTCLQPFFIEEKKIILHQTQH